MKAYFGGLSRRLAPRGYEPKALIDAIWAGTGAMVRNDGSRINEEAFWDTFCGIFGERAREDMPYFEAFYREDFENVRVSCGYTPRAAKVIAQIKEKGCQVALATNPLFPAMATESRIRWAGLSPDDFVLYTTYENSRYCKPNPAYYREIAKTLDVDPAECLMVGNDVAEDMVAETLGMRVFLLTDCLINRDGRDISAYPHGGFDELCDYLSQNLV